MIFKIYHNRPSISQLELDSVYKVISSKNLSQAKEVKEFEEEFSSYLGLPKNSAVAISNGTAALYMALWTLKAKGKNIIFPSYTCSSLRHATSMIGGKEKLCDVVEGTPNMSPGLGQKGDIVILTHMYGLPIRFSKKPGVLYIEDACQSLGAKIDGIHTGLQGDIGIFSFYATKIITSAGQGGMLVSRDQSIIEAVRDYLDFDCRNDNKSRFNFQMTDVQAAMGRVQLKRLSEFVEKRKKIFQFYKKLGLSLLQTSKNDLKLESVPYRCILINKNPNLLIKKLKDSGVQAINPLETWELLGNSNQFLSSIKMSQRTVSLPCYPLLNDKNLEEIEIALNGIKKLL